MKLIKVYSFGKVLHKSLYNDLIDIELNNPNWKGIGDEFKPNREWWIIEDKNQIVAYCGHCFVQWSMTNHYIYFNRAWVKKDYRGKGLQKRLIRVRIRNAKKLTNTILTYTIKDNYPSINSLISCGFKLYEPEYKYIDDEVLYFRMDFH